MHAVLMDTVVARVTFTLVAVWHGGCDAAPRRQELGEGRRVRIRNAVRWCRRSSAEGATEHAFHSITRASDADLDRT